MRSLWVEQAVADAPLPNLQGEVFRAQGDATVRLGPAGGESPLDPGAHRGRLRRPRDRPLGGRTSRHGDALQPVGRRPRPPTPRRTRGRFPPRPARCSSTKSGPSWARRKSTAIRPTPTTPNREITGTTWPLIPNIAWW